METGERIAPFLEGEPRAELRGTGIVQLLPSGSGFDHENNLMFFVGLVHAARSRLTIATPYFVPDDALLLAVTSAALRGVSVTIVNSRAVDQQLVAYAQRSYYAQLLAAGVEIRLYPEPWLLHAKAMVVDDDLAAVGTSNFDIRSFTLNLEVTMCLYGPDAVRDVAAAVEAYCARSEPVQPESWSRRSRLQRLLENAARLTSALQ
jgi:cardiolipin synthase